MNSLIRVKSFRNALAVLAAGVGLAGLTPLVGADLLDDFDGSTLNTSLWETLGGKTYSVANSRLTWNADGGNWTPGELDSIPVFFLPPTGQTATIRWALGPAAITVDNTSTSWQGQSIRYQVGIHSANETAGSRQHWSNSTGGIWLDLDNITSANKSGLGGAVYFANDTKAADSQGFWVAGVSITDWNWETAPREFTLEITDTTFAWYDGTTLLASGTWLGLNLDIEFANGFRVMALGMNFESGRGVTSIERVEVQNAGGASTLITAFSASPRNLTSGQSATLSWRIDPNASASIEPGIGNVDERTIDGVGSIQVTPDPVTEPTAVVYTLTVTKDQEQVSRPAAINVQPPPTLMYNDFVDDFPGDSVNPENWEERGDKSSTVADSRIHWNNDGGNWGHGEIDSVLAYPLPAPGESTTIRWFFGPASITTQNSDGSGNSLRYIAGIFSYHETHNWSRQAWQNTTGGIWIDVTSVNDSRPGGVSGGVITANDTKTVDSNGTWLASFDVADWNWQTDRHEFALVVTDYNFTWYNGEQVLGTATWDEVGIDTEFVNGFKIMAAGLNYNDGRGFTSIDKIQVENGAAPNRFRILGVVPGDAGVALSWESTEGFTYSIWKAASVLGPWRTLTENLASQGETTTYTDLEAPGAMAVYRVLGTPPPPLFWADFEAGENLTGWTEEVVFGSSQWQVGAPTSGPGAAHSGSNVYATKLAGTSDATADAGLRTPLIDLRQATSAVLSFYQWFALEDGFDWGRVYLLDDQGFYLQGGVPLAEQTGSSGGWTRRTVALPSEALGRQIRIEFYFASDPLNTDAGWYIDEVRVD